MQGSIALNYNRHMHRPHELSQVSEHQLRQLHLLVSKGEGSTLEFKRRASDPDKIVREMIAFANTHGGILLVGVGDDKTVPGLKHPEDDAHVINQALTTCRPSLEVEEIFVPIDSKRMVIQYEIFESRRKPHYRLNNAGEKESFVRVQDKSIRASREVREIIRRKAKPRNIRFAYGDHEHTLMKHLDVHPHITLRQYTELTGLRKFVASQKLIRLVLAGVLRIMPDERGDLFTMQVQRDD